MWKLALFLEEIAQYLKKKSGGVHYYVLSFEFGKEEEREIFDELVYEKIYGGNDEFKLEYKVLTEYFD